jgi:hypothetical protein
MENHPLYTEFKQKAADGELSIQQVRGLSYNDAAELLGRRGFSFSFLVNMKDQLISEMQDGQDESNKQLFAAKVETLRSKFPDLQVERGRRAEKPYIIIWLKGKPGIA